MEKWETLVRIKVAPVVLFPNQAYLSGPLYVFVVVGIMAK